MMEQVITSRKNPFLQQVRKLLSSRKAREEAGLFAADGTKLLQEAVRFYPGLDTVILKGEPFTAHISAGSQVKKGDLMMEADIEKIKAAGFNPITPILIGNTEKYNKITLIKEGEAEPGDEVLSLS